MRLRPLRRVCLRHGERARSERKEADGKPEYRGNEEEKSTSVEAKSYVGEGDVVVALTEVTIGSDTAQEADVFTFRDGKVVKAQSIGDTAMQERIFGKKAVAAG